MFLFEVLKSYAMSSVNMLIPLEFRLAKSTQCSFPRIIGTPLLPPAYLTLDSSCPYDEE